MSKIRLALVVMAVMLSMFAWQAGAQEVCTKESPVLRAQFVVGDTWVFNDTSGIWKSEFERYDKGLSVHKHINLRTSYTQYVYLSPDGNLKDIIDFGGKSTFKGDEKPLLRFPLFKGKSWNETFQFESMNASGQYTGMRTRKITVNVIGPETITIAGQAVATCRLQAESYIMSQSNGYEQNEVYWYSPQAKRIVKYQSVIKDWGQRSYELESYTSGNERVAER